jgi:hypothetical protein
MIGNDYRSEIENLIRKELALLGKESDADKIKVVDLGVPHTPRKLDTGTMAVYTFNLKGNFLKIGKVGSRSPARFTYQHYRASGSSSTFAKSLLGDLSMRETYFLNEGNVGGWIKEHCQRIDILIPVELGIFTLNLVEAVLHYKYEPMYEGHESQRHYG